MLCTESGSIGFFACHPKDVGAAYAILRHALRCAATWLSLTIEQTHLGGFPYFQGNLSRMYGLIVTGVHGQPAESSRHCLAICLSGEVGNCYLLPL
jgi:hypothetical protein